MKIGIIEIVALSGHLCIQTTLIWRAWGKLGTGIILLDTWTCHFINHFRHDVERRNCG